VNKPYIYKPGTEVTATFKLTEEVAVAVDFVLEKDYTKDELNKEIQDRLERAGLSRDLEQLDY
jgi:hypothetical protein